jgi:hypothetical protein
MPKNNNIIKNNHQFKNIPLNSDSFTSSLGAKYFVIKSIDEDNIHKSIKYKVWSSTPKGNLKLNKAFIDSNGVIPIYLFFSVNGSGRFVGVARMMSQFDCNTNFTYWSHSEKWKGFFFIDWIFIKDVPNRAFYNLLNK